MEQILNYYLLGNTASNSRAPILKEIDFFGADLYDPAFLLPYFAFTIENFSTFSTRQFLLNSGFQLALLSLSIQTPDVRSSAYEILATFEQKLTAELEASKDSTPVTPVLGRKITAGSGSFGIKNSTQIKLILSSLKNGITQKNQKLPGIISRFVSEVATNVMCRPDHWLYNTTNSFFLRRPYLDISDIPMFNELFNSTKADSYLKERSYILQLLASGISDADDVHMCQKKKLFSILTAFADSGYVYCDSTK